jgi:hypothetical protein
MFDGLAGVLAQLNLRDVRLSFVERLCDSQCSGRGVDPHSAAGNDCCERRKQMLECRSKSTALAGIPDVAGRG